MAIATTLEKFLQKHGVEYDIMAHPRSYTSMETAQVSHVPGDSLAKSVLLRDGQGYLVAVLPATHRLDLERMERLLDRHVELATEKEAGALFGDCDSGAIPPCGKAYGLGTIVDEALTRQREIWFEAGDHEELVHLGGAQFDALMENADHAAISRHV
ncbi:MAG: YbaK/EbsC family protein [Gammaproteobacteria bacterium]|nr:YbaK/EbsC family protein [Gammaproteobacteria bacterium]